MRKPATPELAQYLHQLVDQMTVKELFEFALTKDTLMWVQTNILDPVNVSRTYDEWVENEIFVSINSISAELTHKL